MAGLLNATTPDHIKPSQDLYKNTFGREGDAEGVQYWAGQLASGVPANQVSDNLKTSAKTVYQDYLTNPNSANASNPEINNLLSADLKSGVAQGAVIGSSQQNIAQQGLNTSIYNNLYGAPPESQSNQVQAPAQPIQPTSSGLLNSVVARPAPTYDASLATAGQAGTTNYSTTNADAVSAMRNRYMLFDARDDEENMSAEYIARRVDQGAHPLLEAYVLYARAEHILVHYLLPLVEEQ
mgnify:CR=1 FL=1